MQLTAHGLRLVHESEATRVWEPGPLAVGVAQERTIRVPGVATFQVTGGSRVSISGADGADPVEVRASLEGRVTAALLQQRGTLPLHLAAVVVRDQAIGFVGPPGSGKSSLACAMAERGHALLTDDLAAVTTDVFDRLALHPGPTAMRIWGSSASQLGWPTDDEHRIKERIDKYAYDLPDRFTDGPKRLAAVYVLREHAGRAVLIDQVHGIEKFATYFVGATYNRELLDTPPARAWHFAQVCRIADQVPTFTLGRQGGELVLDRLAAAVERHAASLLVGV